LIHSLQCDRDVSIKYRSSSQIARVVTEHWCSLNLYCAGCTAESLVQSPPNTKAVDFTCAACNQTYQVKSQRYLNLNRIPDGAYGTMLHAVQNNMAPNLLVLNYSAEWTIKWLFLIPSVFFTESVLERRLPLSPSARRAGWEGCNILLSNVPNEGKIPVINDTQITSASLVRHKFKRYQELQDIEWHVRGWTLDVLRAARAIGHRFTLKQIYAQESELLRLHPKNQNVRAKIRQQLQVLRDLNYLEFLGNGSYRFKIPQ
jgi:type II restriction enzyme